MWMFDYIILSWFCFDFSIVWKNHILTDISYSFPTALSIWRCSWNSPYSPHYVDEEVEGPHQVSDLSKATGFMGSQRVGHDWATELNWTELRSGYVETQDNHLVRNNFCRATHIDLPRMQKGLKELGGINQLSWLLISSPLRCVKFGHYIKKKWSMS